MALFGKTDKLKTLKPPSLSNQRCPLNSFAMIETEERALKRLGEANIISPVKHSEWAAPLEPVEKRDNSRCLYGDYKVSVKPALETNNYLLPC